jgi:hypothetical protein
MRRRWGFRGWAMVWAVLQFALPAGATLADARLERQSVGAEAHAESRSDASCRPVHSAECALCQLVLRASAPAAGQASLAAVVQVVARPPIADRPWHALADPTGSPLARAPPLG